METLFCATENPIWTYGELTTTGAVEEMEMYNSASNNMAGLFALSPTAELGEPLLPSIFAPNNMWDLVYVTLWFLIWRTFTKSERSLISPALSQRSHFMFRDKNDVSDVLLLASSFKKSLNHSGGGGMSPMPYHSSAYAQSQQVSRHTHSVTKYSPGISSFFFVNSNLRHFYFLRCRRSISCPQMDTRPTTGWTSLSCQMRR